MVCRLLQSSEMAFAVDYKVTSVSSVPGFACSGVATNYVNWVGFVEVYFAKDMKASHGAGKTISNVNCKQMSKYVFTNSKDFVLES